MKRKEIIAKHEERHPVWLATDGRWKTKVADETKKSGMRMIAKSKQEDLHDALVEWYAKDPIPDTLENLYPEWILYKSKGNDDGERKQAQLGMEDPLSRRSPGPTKDK